MRNLKTISASHSWWTRWDLGSSDSPRFSVQTTKFIDSFIVRIPSRKFNPPDLSWVHQSLPLPWKPPEWPLRRTHHTPLPGSAGIVSLPGRSCTRRVISVLIEKGRGPRLPTTVVACAHHADAKQRRDARQNSSGPLHSKLSCFVGCFWRPRSLHARSLSSS